MSFCPKFVAKSWAERFWELPAGGVQGNEIPEDVALRELGEETEIYISDPSRLLPLDTLVVSPNRLPIFPLIYQVDLSKEEFEARSAHDDKVESVASFSSDKIREMILSGEIITSITIAILGRYLISKELTLRQKTNSTNKQQQARPPIFLGFFFSHSCFPRSC